MSMPSSSSPNRPVLGQLHNMQASPSFPAWQQPAPQFRYHPNINPDTGSIIPARPLPQRNPTVPFLLHRQPALPNIAVRLRALTLSERASYHPSPRLLNFRQPNPRLLNPSYGHDDRVAYTLALQAAGMRGNRSSGFCIEMENIRDQVSKKHWKGMRIRGRSYGDDGTRKRKRQESVTTISDDPFDHREAEAMGYTEEVERLKRLKAASEEESLLAELFDDRSLKAMEVAAGETEEREEDDELFAVEDKVTVDRTNFCRKVLLHE